MPGLEIDREFKQIPGFRCLVAILGNRFLDPRQSLEKLVHRSIVLADQHKRRRRRVTLETQVLENQVKALLMLWRLKRHVELSERIHQAEMTGIRQGVGFQCAFEMRHSLGVLTLACIHITKRLFD